MYQDIDTAEFFDACVYCIFQVGVINCISFKNNIIRI